MKPPVQRHPYAGYAALACAAVLFLLVFVMTVSA